MKLYNSYIKKRETGDIEDLIFIKNGFSISALIFNCIWFFYHKMFKATIAAAMAIWILMQLINLLGIEGYSSFLLSFLCVSLIMGVNGNFWHSKYLRARNYEFIGCFFGDNREAAKLRFVEQYIGEVGEQTMSRYKFLDKQDREVLKNKMKKANKS